MVDFVELTGNYKKWAEEIEEKGLSCAPADEYIYWLNIAFDEARDELVLYRRMIDETNKAQLEGAKRLAKFRVDLAKKQATEKEYINCSKAMGRPRWCRCHGWQYMPIGDG